MWNLSVPHWWEFLARAVLVYLLILVLLRLTGKRQVGNMSPFDLVLLLLLSNSVQNAMNGGDNSVTAGALLASTLVGLNWIIGWLTYRSKTAERLVEGRPVIIVHDGHVLRKTMASVQMTMHELESALREEGCAGPEEVKFAILENNGHLSVLKHESEGNGNGKEG